MSILEEANPLKSAADIAKSFSTGLDELFTSDEERMRAQLLLEQNLQKPHILQAVTNLEEAKSPNLFVSGWRPALGWLCVLLLAYSWIGRDAIIIVFDLFPTAYVEVRSSQNLHSSINELKEFQTIETSPAEQEMVKVPKHIISNASNTIKNTIAAYDLAKETHLRQLEQKNDGLANQLPDLDSGAIMSLVLALLGLGASRTYEKVSGVARTRWKEPKPTSATEQVNFQLPKDDFSEQEYEDAFFKPTRKKTKKSRKPGAR